MFTLTDHRLVLAVFAEHVLLLCFLFCSGVAFLCTSVAQVEVLWRTYSCAYV